ncbi:MAG TPA: hypothetical protein VLC98_09815 [Phnomibacter sp.]|nr:hypothetical protein [Phnomibacter sp.]
MIHKACICIALCVGASHTHAQYAITPIVSMLVEELTSAGNNSVHYNAKLPSNSLPLSISVNANTALKEDVLSHVTRWHRTTGKHMDEYIGWYANGKQALVVQMRKTSMHGQWQTWYQNGQQRDAGMFVHNKPHGLWKSWYANGKLRSERQYDAHKMQMVELAVRQRNPKLAFSPISKQAIQQPQKLQQYFSANAGLDKMSKLSASYEFPFAQCLHHGFYANYYENGVLQQSGYYKEGLKDGLWMKYAEQGNLNASGYYDEGRLHGPKKEYNSSGALQKLSEYKHGKKLFEKNYPARH